MEIGNYTVHVVDDEEPVRKSLAFLLATAGFTVRLHESATAFLAVAPSIRDGCPVTDLRMPDMTGVELLRQLQTRKQRLPAIVITGHGDVPLAVEAMKAGALDFIEKPFAKQALLDSLEEGFRRLSRREVTEDRMRNAVVRLQALTSRERDVLNGLAQGLPNKTIAYDLGISPRTVEIHRANLMSKLKVRSLSEALRLAFVAQGE